MPNSLGYLGFTTPAIDAWPGFATDVLGCMVLDGAQPGVVRLGMDDAAWRLQLEPGDIDDLAYIGWEMSNEQELRDHLDRLRDAGIEVVVGDDSLKADRCANQLYWFIDPIGFRHELVLGRLTVPGMFRPGRPMVSRFVTGEQGLGHVVLGVPDLAAAHQFYTEVLGLELSDTLIARGGSFEARFYHCNGRHHSLAIGETPGYRGIDHIMMEVGHLDDVGFGQDACRGAGVRIVKELGRHTNDKMISFYLQTPSTFLIEYGWGGLNIDPAWVTNLYRTGSAWGHHQTSSEPVERIRIPVE